MIRAIIHILLICILIIVMNFIYQVFYTYPYHNGKPVLFVPPLTFPTFLIIVFILGGIITKFIMKMNWFGAFLLAFIITFTFFFIATYIEKKYTYLYNHYYQNHPYNTLIHLQDYSEKRDNYITLGKALKNEGIKVNSIEGGYTEKGHINSPPEHFQKKLYYVNNDLYIIFDWDKEEITRIEDKQSIRQAIAKQYGDFPEVSDRRFSHSEYTFSMLDEDGMTVKRYIIEPTERNTFEFIQTR